MNIGSIERNPAEVAPQNVENVYLRGLDCNQRQLALKYVADITKSQLAQESALVSDFLRNPNDYELSRHATTRLEFILADSISKHLSLVDIGGKLCIQFVDGLGLSRSIEVKGKLSDLIVEKNPGSRSLEASYGLHTLISA